MKNQSRFLTTKTKGKTIEIIKVSNQIRQEQSVVTSFSKISPSENVHLLGKRRPGLIFIFLVVMFYASIHTEATAQLAK